MNCDFCKKTFSSKSNLLNHKKTAKYCLKMQEDREEKEENNKKLSYECIYCKKVLTQQKSLDIHIISCKEKKKKIDLENISLIKNLEKEISKLEKKDNSNFIKIKEYEKTIQEKNEYILKLEAKIEKFENTIASIANEPKTTTTTNTVNNSIRNMLSSDYTLEKLEPKKLEQTLREHYTERDFFNGQKGLANCCVEKIAKTPDGKMLICCCDMSRKKFKILDVNGNLKEDIEARLLCQKLKVPIQAITKEIYDKVIDRIDTERERLTSDDRSRREKLLDDTMRAQQVYIDNMNFDDLNYNQDFMHELCVLLNV